MDTLHNSFKTRWKFVKLMTIERIEQQLALLIITITILHLFRVYCDKIIYLSNSFLDIWWKMTFSQI